MSISQVSHVDLLMAERNDSGWDGTSWVPGDSVEYIYNDDSLLIQETVLNYDTSGWQNHERINTTYGTNQTITELEFLNWDASKGWQPGLRILTDYNSNDSATVIVIQTWSEGQGWRNRTRTLRRCNENNYLSAKESYRFDSVEWKKLERDSFEYNEDGYITRYLAQVGDDNSAMWVNDHQGLYIYDSLNNRVESINQNYAGLWVNTLR